MVKKVNFIPIVPLPSSKEVFYILSQARYLHRDLFRAYLHAMLLRAYFPMGVGGWWEDITDVYECIRMIYDDENLLNYLKHVKRCLEMEEPLMNYFIMLCMNKWRSP